MALAGVSIAETITLDDSFYVGSYIYVWNTETNSWDYSPSIDATSLTTGSGWTPTKDPYFVGYTFAYANGVQTLTSTNVEISIAAQKWLPTKGIYIGGNVTLTGNDNGIYAGTKLHFADISTSQFAYSDRVWKQGTVNVTGSITLSDINYSRTFITVANMQQADGGWDFSNFSVTDANGNSLTYASDAENIGKAGYFWVEESAFKQGASYKATLVAKAIPEPTTATLSLLALAGLAARRRRK